MGIGGAAAALLGAGQAEAAPASSSGRSIADWGIVPNAERDQSAAMQKAIDELAVAGQPIAVPAGRYRFARLNLPSHATILGVPGLTFISATGEGLPVFECIGRQDVSLRGLAFSGTGLIASECRNLTVVDCQILASGGDGFVCGGTGLFIAANRANACAKSAIWAEGDGILTNNLINGPGQFGLRIGSAARLGKLTAINNRIEGAAIGIGISSADAGYALIAMNMILGAAGGGIRALDGDKLAGKDLTRGGSEAFPNIAIAANVSL